MPTDDIRVTAWSLRASAGSTRTFSGTATDADGDPLDLDGHDLVFLLDADAQDVTTDEATFTLTLVFPADQTEAPLQILFDDVPQTAGTVYLSERGTEDFDSTIELRLEPLSLALSLIGTAATSGGGGAVTSVNGRVGVVVGLAEQADLTAEASARAAADTALDGRLDTIEAISIATDAELAAAVAAEAALARNADNLASGTVADARIPSTIARDTEVTAAVLVETNARVADVDAEEAARIAGDAALDTRVDALELAPPAHAASHADGGSDEISLTGEQITSGTVADARIASTIARDSEVTAAIAALSTVYQPLDSDLTAIAALTTTAYGRALLALADAAAARTALALGSAALAATGDFDPAGSAAAAQAASQPLDATLTALAAADWAANAVPIGSGANALAQVSFAANKFPARASSGNLVAKDITDFGLSLVDDTDATAARTTLGLGTLATQSGTFSGTSSGTNTGDQTITLTGDVTGSGTGSFAATIANDAVTNAKAANMAQATIKGRQAGAGTGDPEDLTAAQARTAMGLGTAALVDTGTGGANVPTVTQADARYAPIGVAIPADKTADYAVVAADADSSIGVDSATAKNVTVPLNATSAFPVGRIVEVRQVGAGQVTLVPESGSVILRAAGGALKTRAQYSAVSLLKVATNTWSVQGDLSA